MQRYVIKRVLGIVPVVLLVGVIGFTLVHLTPGDPAAFFVGDDAGPEEVARVRQQLGLDQPVWIQFTRWFGGLLRGDLGTSFYYRQPVWDAFMLALPPTLVLTASALLIAVVLAIPIGVLSAIRQNSWIDKVATIFVLIGVSMPNFWLGLLMILLFAVTLGWLPAQGYVSPGVDLGASFRSVILPAIALGYSAAALIARMTRSAMLEVLRQDFVRTARSKGLRERSVLYKHALTNAFIPVLTVIGLTVASLLSGSVVVETVFNYPGVGRLVVDSVLRRDYPVIQGSLLLIAMITIVVNLLVDLLYAVVDPRIQYE